MAVILAHGRLVAASGLAVGLALGAAPASAMPPGETTRPTADRGVVTTEAPGPAQPAELRRISYADWTKRLAAEWGHVVVVDLWATWCLPCLDRFPHLIELARRYGPRGVRFLSLSLDDTSDPRALAYARRFLAENNATFPNYLLDEPMLSAFEKLGIAGIPAVFVYDRNGTLYRRLTTDDPNAQFTDEDVERTIEALLAAGGG